MTRAALDPQMQDKNIVCTANSMTEIKEKQTYLAISAQESKKYSFFFHVHELQIGDQFPSEPILKVDLEKVGPLTGEDKVDLFHYRVPAAKQVDVAIPATDHPYVLQGDWSAKLRAPLLGQVFELGDNVNVTLTVEYQGRDVPITIHGLMAISEPGFPVEIGPLSIIRLRKMDAVEFTRAKQYLAVRRVQRVDDFQTMIKQGYDKLIAELKTKAQFSLSDSLQFYDIPCAVMNQAIQGFFTGFEQVNEQSSEDQGKFSFSRTFVIREDLKPALVLEYHMMGTTTKGAISVTVHGNNELNTRGFQQNIINNINKIHRGLKTHGSQARDVCPHCGSKLELGVKVVKCKYCKRIIEARP